MDATMLRTLGLAAAFAASVFSSPPVSAQSCGCTHQGGSVDCPSGLPPGSKSVEFVPGGTQWVTPSGQTVFVPQTSFACNGPTTPQAAPPPSKPSTSAPTPAHTDRDSGNRRHDALIGAGAAVLIDQLHKKDDKHRRPEGPPPCDSPSCTAHLREDPAIACYRRVSATVNDGHGTPHTGTLYDQLVKASGVEDAALAPTCTQGLCEEPGYDCGGTFYDAAGQPVHAPPFPSATIRTEEDLRRWKASVSDFYRMSFLDPHRGGRLSPGKAAVCSLWAELRSQSDPDRSVLDAMDTLQRIGGESTQPDVGWIDHIQSAGTSNGCGTLPLPPGHDMDSFAVPEESARSFLRSFRDCSQEDTNHVGGCPHAFGPVNHVNARYILHFINLDHPSLGPRSNGEAVFFAEAEGGFSGDDCRQTSCTGKCDQKTTGRTCAEGGTPRTNVTSLTGNTSADCDAAIRACIGDCQASNQALSRQCIESGGEPIPGVCAVNAASCSCTQTATECRRR